MLYLYDNAIVDDLKKSFNTDEYDNSVVSIVPPDQILGIAAQIQDDKLHFPIISLERDSEYHVDEQRNNFTRKHKGVATVFDNKHNTFYYEKAIPITLSYTLIAMSTNTADVDEIIRELLFKYSDMYFLTISTPYESKRKIRFGIEVDDNSIQSYTTTSNYLSEGKLHSAGIQLKLHGAVLLEYTPVRMKSIQVQVEPTSPIDTKSK